MNCLLRSNTIHKQYVRFLYSTKCGVTKVRRNKFTLMYDTTLVFKDGSTIQFRHSTPSAILNIPTVFEDLTTNEEKLNWFNRRRKIEAYNLVEDKSDVTIDRTQYLKHFKK